MFARVAQPIRLCQAILMLTADDIGGRRMVEVDKNRMFATVPAEKCRGLLMP